MSRHEAAEPECTQQQGDVTLVIRPRERDLGGFGVRRLLPAPARQAVGPFVFFDHMGPARFAPGHGIDVRPHPHIGLATVTYLFEGRIRHRDSLGCVQDIEPGAVNHMVAGSGIVHSERSTDTDRAAGSSLHGIQMWMALPDAEAECEPAFSHYPAADLPRIAPPGVELRVLIGTLHGVNSPVRVPSETLCCDVQLVPGANLDVARGAGQETALYVVNGCVSAGGCRLEPHTMAVLAPGRPFRVSAREQSRCFLIGGTAVGPRTLWWNFVARDAERIQQARDRWRTGAFAPVPGETEFIPLPD